MSFVNSKVLKWCAIAVAGAAAAYQTFTEQKEEERIDDMESRIAKLEEEMGEAE